MIYINPKNPSQKIDADPPSGVLSGPWEGWISEREWLLQQKTKAKGKTVKVMPVEGPVDSKPVNNE